MNIREVPKDDWKSIWPIFNEIVSAGETYAYDKNTSNYDAKKIWLETPKKVFVFEEDGLIISAGQKIGF